MTEASRGGTTPQEIADAIRHAIRDGWYRPGQEIIQSDVAARFGVSRVPLREALRLLVGEGLLQYTQGSGAAVTRLDADEVDELYQLRLQLEPQFSGRVIERSSPREIQRLRKYIERMAEADDARSWGVLNFEFHLAMYRIAGTGPTLRIIEQLLYLTQPYVLIYVEYLVEAGRRRRQDEHGEMLEALTKGDVERLTAMIRIHLEHARETLVAAMRAAGDAEKQFDWLLGATTDEEPAAG